MATDQEIEALILEMTRESKNSIAPLDVARRLAPDSPTWQRLIPNVRRAADRLAAAGQVEYLRKGKPIPAAEARGVVRLRARVAGE
jgi:hypothetical protein